MARWGEEDVEVEDGDVRLLPADPLPLVHERCFGTSEEVQEKAQN
jgi:hypothetical protein